MLNFDLVQMLKTFYVIALTILSQSWPVQMEFPEWQNTLDHTTDHDQLLLVVRRVSLRRLEYGQYRFAECNHGKNI